ncbi:DUF1028 domain-containing protein [Devosia nitrariae]|uniref:Pilus assembly protein n=1 Tax=Devosia nitrariae TaxID=2071872 RepID=A0ABQ5WDJ5_9HYPH|nr:DUF1028 domain-containing protein [Devosia nitrariae]GLQ57859.1 pilus assembly protein [Devosia nitrariae]
MTFSIVARDPATRALGVATATGGPVVGSLVPHARAGVGAIATQASTNGLYAYDGLDALARPGADAQTVLDQLVAGDPQRERRQCLIIDFAGSAAVWTGSACEPYADARIGSDVAVGGNLLADAGVLQAMLEAFAATSGALEDRLLAALTAGEHAGGDRRGTRSAALKVYTNDPFPATDLRADWSEQPIADLGAILAATREPGYADFFNRLPRRV